MFYFYVNPIYMKQTPKTYKEQIRKNIIKKRLCKENNVTLINVPYYIPNNKILEFI